MDNNRYVIGVDFGSDSVRAAVVCTNGKIISRGVSFYRRWKMGLYQHPEKNIFRQHPLDYVESLEECIKEALGSLDKEIVSKICGIGIDTTGSTPVPVDIHGTPLALLKEFAECEDAMFHLWKDHSAAREAEELNHIFMSGTKENYTRYQGQYCSEWYWAKILHTIRRNPKIKQKAYTWIEHCDWIVGLLTGKSAPQTMYHSTCAAGHKALWHSAWNGLPSSECLAMADTYLAEVAERYGRTPLPATTNTGNLNDEWAKRLGLSGQVIVSGSSFDAHAGAIGAGIRRGTMVCILGTSAVDLLIEKPENLFGKNLVSLCGRAENSIIEGYTGIETGQAAFGDIFAWYKKILLWPLKQASKKLSGEKKCLCDELAENMENQLLEWLQEEAEKLPEEPFPIALDWFNGRRYPDTDDYQMGSISQLSLGANAPHVYRGLVFGAVCGLRRLVDGFEKAGLEIREIIAVGGIARKSSYIMQMMASVLEKNVKIPDTDQICALGAAINAAVAAGQYPDIETALRYMAAKPFREFTPDAEKCNIYRQQYEKYRTLADMDGDYR